MESKINEGCQNHHQSLWTRNSRMTPNSLNVNQKGNWYQNLMSSKSWSSFIPSLTKMVTGVAGIVKTHDVLSFSSLSPFTNLRTWEHHDARLIYTKLLLPVSPAAVAGIVENHRSTAGFPSSILPLQLTIQRDEVTFKLASTRRSH
jgi:hypothetical protein